MAMYTQSLKTLIELDAYKKDIDLDLNIDNYITTGKNLLFGYPLSNYQDFNNFFTSSFIIKFFNENINEDFAPLWMKKLQLQVQRTIVPYAELFHYIQTLTGGEMIRENARTVTTDRSGKNSGKSDSSTESDTVAKASSFPNTVNMKTDVSNIRYANDGSKTESTGISEASQSSEYSENVKNIEETFGNILDKISQSVVTYYDVVDYFVDTFKPLFLQIW